MIFETHPILPPLEKYVESIFYHKDYMPAHTMERVVPTGHVFLIFELDNIPRHTFDKNLQPNATFTKAWVSGVHQNYLTISEHKHTEMLVVQFKSLGAFPFFHVPVNSFAETVRPADEFFGPDIFLLRERIMQASEPVIKLSMMNDWLIARLDEKKAPPEELSDILSRFQTHPFSRHNDIVTSFPKTQKHLISQFKKYAGLSPKTLHKVIRFNSLLQIIHQKEEISWTDIVYETGYSDQSHFIREFQEFSGFTPSSYLKKGYNESIPNFFPIDPEG